MNRQKARVQAQGRKEMRNLKGQASIEVIAIAIVMTLLLLLVITTVHYRNLETENISEATQKSIQCNAISEAIYNAYNNRAKSKQVLFVRKNALIKKAGGSVGSVSVEGITCSYVGSVQGEESGVNMVALKNYSFKKEGGNVVVCETPC